ncbi:hypothetical protein ScPMuIL_006608 [Solemya velum]
MSMSGITVQDDIVKTFEDMKMNKTYRFLKLTVDGKSVIVQSKEPRANKADDQKSNDEDPSAAEYSTDCEATLEDNKCGWLIYDMQMSAKSEERHLIFVTWCPDTANVKDKMITSSTSEYLKKKFNGIKLFVQATDRSELDVHSIRADLQKKYNKQNF